MKLLLLSLIVVCFTISCDNVTEENGDLNLWYEQPASEWLEALPLGNGRIGAMVYGGVEEEHLQLNEESLWAGMPEDPYPDNVGEHYQNFQKLNLIGEYKKAYDYAMDNLAISPTSIRSYEPLGDLYIHFDHKGKVEDYRRKLDLETGVFISEYKIEGKRYRRESFISTKYDVILYRFISLDKKTTSASFRFEREKDISKSIINGQILEVAGQIFDDTTAFDDNQGGSGQGGYHMKFFSHVGVVTNGGVSSKGNNLVVDKSADFTMILSTATDYNPDKMNFDRTINSRQISLDKLEKALNTPYKEMKEDHVRAHAEIFNRVSLDIQANSPDSLSTDTRIERVRNGAVDVGLEQLFFQYGRYLVMSSAMGNSALPSNLQGIWNQDMWAPWESDFHLNINLQMNYWPVDVCNLSEAFVPLTDFMTRLSEKGKIPAKKYINSDGWMAHHATNPFGRVTPNGSTKSSQVTNGYSYPLAGAWMALSIWRHYEYTQDKEYLRDKAYPLIKGAARFILDFLKENEKGELVTAPSYSPENSYIDPETGNRHLNTVAATMDIQIMRDVFSACLAAEDILELNELTSLLNEAELKLPKTKIGKNGTIQEWYEDYIEVEPGHRHISHLFGLYPSNQINSETMDLYEAAAKTIERRLREGGGQSGWSRAWVINFYARLKDGNKSLYHLRQLFTNQSAPNLLDFHPPRLFQIDGNFGATAGVAEMLIQSHEPGKIYLLPALPDDWSNGSVKGLKTRGNFEVDMEWKEGKVTKAKVYAPIGGNVKIQTDDREVEVQLAAGESEEIFN